MRRKAWQRLRRAREERTFTPEQKERIHHVICDKRPEQLKMDSALWIRVAVMQFIKKKCGVTLHVRSVGKYLTRWGFTPQKPIKRAYEQSQAAVKAGM